MVYETKTFRCLHELTEQGELEYRKMLEKEADLILWKNKHKVRALGYKILAWFGCDMFSKLEI